MATATTSAAATGPVGIYVYTEFGSPEYGSPGTYGWLGADQISSNALGTQLLMGARAYNSASGRFSQVDPIAGGSANAYDYVSQNPLTNYDLSGQWCFSWHCVEEDLIKSAVFAVFAVASAAIVALCTAATSGLCGVTIGMYVVGISMGAADGVVTCWSTGCSGATAYAQAAVIGTFTGGMATWLGRVGIRAAAATRFRGSFLELAQKLLSRIRYWRL